MSSFIANIASENTAVLTTILLDIQRVAGEDSNNFFMDSNCIDIASVNYLTDSIISNQGVTTNELASLYARRGSLIELIDARTRYLNRFWTPVVEVMPHLPVNVWTSVYNELVADLSGHGALGDYVSDTLNGNDTTLYQGHNFTSQEIKLEMKLQLSNMDWSDSFKKLYNE